MSQCTATGRPPRMIVRQQGRQTNSGLVRCELKPAHDGQHRKTGKIVGTSGIVTQEYTVGELVFLW